MPKGTPRIAKTRCSPDIQKARGIKQPKKRRESLRRKLRQHLKFSHKASEKAFLKAGDPTVSRSKRPLDDNDENDSGGSRDAKRRKLAVTEEMKLLESRSKRPLDDNDENDSGGSRDAKRRKLAVTEEMKLLETIELSVKRLQQMQDVKSVNDEKCTDFSIAERPKHASFL